MLKDTVYSNSRVATMASLHQRRLQRQTNQLTPDPTQGRLSLGLSMGFFMADFRNRVALPNSSAWAIGSMGRWRLRACVGLCVVALWLGIAVGVQAQTANPELIEVNVPNAEPATSPRMAEVRGLLPHTNDHHYFGLEAMHPGVAFAVTLTVEPAASMADPSAVNFLVLTEKGLSQFLAGANPQAVKVAEGAPLLFDQAGNRLTTLVPGSLDGGYTVIVYNQSEQPVAYTLQVEGAILHDDAGQTYAAYGLVEPSNSNATSAQRLLARTSPVAAVDMAALTASSLLVQRLAAQTDMAPESVAAVGGTTPNGATLMELAVPGKESPLAVPVRARRVTGTLGVGHDRHYLNLVADESLGEIIMRLTPTDQDGGTTGNVNFWVMTQDGVRHLIQGVQPDEVTLATGSTTADGVIEARFRAAQHVVYTVVVFNEQGVPVDYALQVSGGMVLDLYGQTREARAAAMEMLALSD